MAGHSTIEGRAGFDLQREIECPEPVEGLAWVYVLQSINGSLYVGQSNDVRERLRNHRIGLGSKHTRDHGQSRLIYVEGPMSPQDAVKPERQLKGWSRAKKHALIRGDLEMLRQLSRSQQ